jgi:nucleoside-diphosphate-sugar epimerase
MLDARGEVVAIDTEAIREVARSFGSKGMRVIAFCRRDGSHVSGDFEHHHVSEGLTFLGLQGMIDPPREGAFALVKALAELIAEPALAVGWKPPARIVYVSCNPATLARDAGVRRFVYASSSSGYGDSPELPKVEERVGRPLSPYAATKLVGEQMCSNYSHLYGIKTVSLRFFTVYGPGQSPGLAISKFTRLMEEGKPIDKFGDGTTRRDYTYIDDIVDGIIGALNYRTGPICDIFNLGGSQNVSLNDLISTIEQALGKKATINQLPEQPGDVPITSADVSKAKALIGFKPTTSIAQGVPKYVEWFHDMRARGIAVC